MSKPYSRSGSFLILILAHICAAGAAGLAWFLLDDWTVLQRSAVADGCGMLVMFGFCYGLKNSSLFDAWWSLAPIALVGVWSAVSASDGTSARAWLVVVLLSLYGVRLTWNWALGWQGMGHEDWRYLELQKKTGRGWWATSFFGLHIYPTTIVFFCCVPAWHAISSESSWNVFASIGALLLAGGLALETLADLQLHAFRKAPEHAGLTCRQGLWRWSRHPNYLGELLVWWGVLGLGLSTGEASLWLSLAPLFLTLMMLVSSIPMMEERMLRTRTDYMDYQRSTSRLLLWIPRSTTSE
jgi:steroid 5-alpha reductase family enzyme